MAYVAPTPADMKARFPRFVAVPDNIVQQALNEAARQVDETWTEGDFAMGRMLYAAHVMTLDGLGAGTEAELLAEGVEAFQEIKLGSLQLKRFDKDSRTNGNDYLDLLASTSYGRRFLATLKQNAGGPVMASGGSAQPSSHLARDWPTLPGLYPFNQRFTR